MSNNPENNSFIKYFLCICNDVNEKLHNVQTPQSQTHEFKILFTFIWKGLKCT